MRAVSEDRPGLGQPTLSQSNVRMDPGSWGDEEERDVMCDDNAKYRASPSELKLTAGAGYPPTLSRGLTPVPHIALIIPTTLLIAHSVSDI